MARNFYRFNIPSGDAYDTAYSNNMAFMQYEYDEINGTSEVTGNWNVIKQVKENDIILLGYDSRIYAWGYAIKPRKRKNIKYLNVAEMQEKRLEIDGVKYMSGKYNGIIYFQDCECFYDNLTKIMEWDDFNRCWGQRIDIDKWRCNPDNKSISSYLKDYLETPRYTISRIKNNERACEIIKELTGDDIMLDNQNKSNCIELIQNKNLILTGAPGTGKTYLAKQIAEEIIIRNYYEKNKNELEKYYNECEELRKQFIGQFPIGTLKSISIDDYCIGKGNKNSFCYWIEFKLRNSGFFDCGTANSYLLYYDTNGNLKNTSIIINNDELIKEIGEAIYKMATEKEYNGDLKFKGDKTTIKFAMKIYNSYNPYYYFPIFSSDYMNKICEIFNIVKDKNPYKQNLNIKEYFDKNFKDINPVIMKEMLIRNFFKNDDDFKKQCEFVQFHPSYDYTDFVEGLRPKNDNGNIGFERKDGVFKAFCKKALKNLKDSKKDISTLNYDEIIKKYLEDFYNDIEKEITTNGFYEIYGIGGGIAAPIIDIVYKEDEKEFRFTVKTKNDREHIIIKKLDLMTDYYKKFITKKPEEFKFKDFIDELKITHYHTYIYGFLKAFYDKYNEKIEQEKNNITIEEVKEKKFIFIIDEINRGEISKIFGELFFSVDSSYRGEKGKVQTQYANLIEDGDEFKDGFYIPENVYIIGTMNDIDRSVESMDFAMRRRFAWKEIKAEDTQETILNDLENLKDETIKRMNNLNKVIRNKETNLSEAYCIGAAYFKKIKDYEGDFNKLWENHLKGLLFEYTRGMPKQEEIMENLKKAYYLNNTKTENNNEEENANNTNN